MKNVSVIILCGGSQKRWDNHLGVEKQFAEINGKVIIDNTIQMLKQSDVDITIITRVDTHNYYKKFNCKIVAIPIEYSELEYFKFKSNFDIWNNNGKTILLWGDVFYSHKALNFILSKNSKNIIFFGRQAKNFFTKCDHGELLGISFLPMHHTVLRLSCKRLEYFIEKQNIKIAGGWGMYDIISGLEHLFDTGLVIKGRVLLSNFYQILDYTDDIDYPNDYDNYVLYFKKRTTLNQFLNAVKSKIYYSYKSLENLIYELFTIKKRLNCLKESHITKNRNI